MAPAVGDVELAHSSLDGMPHAERVQHALTHTKTPGKGGDPLARAKKKLLVKTKKTFLLLVSLQLVKNGAFLASRFQ